MRITLNEKKAMLNPLKYLQNRSVGLVLGSGGAKGLAHVAVIEYLESMGIPIDLVTGSSIGAVTGAFYCMGTLERFKEDILKITTRDMITFMDPVIPRSGLLAGKGFVKFMERYIPKGAKIEDLKIPLAVVATDYITGLPVIFRSGSILEALRASISIPGVLVPVRYKETLLVDGGVANPLPIGVAKSMGAGMTIAVNLHPQVRTHGLKSFVKEQIDTTSDTVNSRDIEIIKNSDTVSISRKKNGIKWLKAVEQWRRADRSSKKQDIPNIFNVISQSIDIMEYINTMLLLRYDPPTVLIEPNVMDVGTLGFTEAKRIITEGYLACSRVKSLLNRKVKMWV